MEVTLELLEKEITNTIAIVYDTSVKCKTELEKFGLIMELDYAIDCIQTLKKNIGFKAVKLKLDYFEEELRSAKQYLMS
jgi:hypothetical protein